MNTNNLFENAAAQYQRGRFKEAEEIAQSILEANPEDADAYHLLGLLAIERGEFANAGDLISQAINYNPEQSIYYYNLGFARYSEERLDEALVAYDQALFLNLDFADAHLYRGMTLNAKGLLDAALEAYDKALKINPDLKFAHNNRANVLKSLGRMDEALMSYGYALKIDPGFALAHANKGSALMELGGIEDALQAYGKAVELEPAFAEAHCSYGLCLKLLGRLSESADAFRLAAVHDPELIDAKYHLASIGEEKAPDKSPKEYVVREFNRFADKFDNTLINKLRYNIPQELYKAVSRQRKQNSKVDILDLGCGTGLCGTAFKDIANRLVGVDLAPRMLIKAKEKNVYSELIEADVCDAMLQCKENFDLVISADVFIYVGALNELFVLVGNKLRKGDLFAFSIEQTEKDVDYELTQTGRYAQSRNYIQRLAKENNFTEVSYAPVIVRYESGKPVSGGVFVLQSL